MTTNTPEQMEAFYRNKSVLVTGAAGTVGSGLVQALGALPVAEVRALDNNESELFFLGEANRDVECILGDLRDRAKLERSFKGIDIVFHAAALKHVPLCERSPMEAVQTNILGVQNVIEAAIACGVERVAYTSSDKAVNPTSVMGTSKLMGEQLMNAANLAVRGNGPVFTSTRFGNVLGSRGSVMPLFADQIRRGGPVRLTSADMTRFVMTRDEAVNLVLSAARQARGGEVLITKMHVIRIVDLAEVMIEELAPAYGLDPAKVSIEIIGLRPGEKIYEELMNVEEVRRSVELSRMFAVLPAVRDLYRAVEYTYPDLVSPNVDRPYISASEPPLGKEGLRDYLKGTGLLAAYKG